MFVTRSPLVLGSVLLLLVMAAQPARSQFAPVIKENVVYSFANGADGASPQSALIRDGQGNLFGTTQTGGTPGFGTVYGVTAAGAERVLYTFTGGADGANPQCTLVRDPQGNLYGTTFFGGAHGFGTVFKVAPRTGVETVLYSFTGGVDGSHPRGGLVRDAQGTFYGTTGAGGNFTLGTVFKLTAGGTETVLHSFNSADGSGPQAIMITDAQGTMYGTTAGGGLHNSGTVFKITQSGTHTVLYNFGTILSDGFSPTAPVNRDAQGNLYGVTEGGGTFSNGTVFKVTAGGTGSVLYSFSGAADGGTPEGGLLRDAAGNLYGTTMAGGNSGCGPSCGVVFEVTAGGIYKVLYSFSQLDGAAPHAGLIPDGKGGGYGTTSAGGTHSSGTVFEVSP